MTVTKKQALKALDRMQSLYPHAKPDATLRQFIEQSASQDSGQAPAPTAEEREAARTLLEMVRGHQYGLRGFGDGSLSRGRNLTDAEERTIRTALSLLAAPAPTQQPPRFDDEWAPNPNDDQGEVTPSFTANLLESCANWLETRAQVPQMVAGEVGLMGIYAADLRRIRAALSGASPTPQPELTDEARELRRAMGVSQDFSDWPLATLMLKAAERIRSLLAASPTQAGEQPVAAGVKEGHRG